jgi:two-component system, cell cycle response regulator DivK
VGGVNALATTRDDVLRDRLVVVTDDLATHRLVQTALEAHHARVISAAGDAEALAVARAARPDLIVACVDSPATDGFALTEQLKTDPTTETIPVLALTSHPTPDLHQRAQATGFDALLIEPLTGAAFAHVAGLLIERAALLRERSKKIRQSAADVVRRSVETRNRVPAAFEPATTPAPAPAAKLGPPLPVANTGAPVSPRCRRCGHQDNCELVRTSPSSTTYRCRSCGQQWRFTFKRPISPQ